VLMSAVVKAIPDVAVLLALEPEELGAKLLLLAKERQRTEHMFSPYAFESEIWEAEGRNLPAYPRGKEVRLPLRWRRHGHGLKHRLWFCPRRIRVPAAVGVF